MRLDVNSGRVPNVAYFERDAGVNTVLVNSERFIAGKHLSTLPLAPRSNVFFYLALFRVPRGCRNCR